jgi:hypothetical protein
MLSGVLAAITCLTFTVSEPLETPAQMPESTTSVSVGTRLWLRGDAVETMVTVYTNGVVGGGYFQIDQIDPAG